MAKSIYNNANVVYQYDTFAGWLTKTNQLISEMGTSVVTTGLSSSPDITTGNAFVNGYFGANTLYVSSVLQGGTANTPGTLNIISNTNINNTFSVGSTSNVTITSTTVRFSNSSSINATSYTGTAANATLFAGVTLGTVNSAITANGDAAYSNALATVATIYQTMAGLPANVAVLTANAAGFLSNSSGTLSNIQSWISGNSAAAYANAVTVANSSAATAYANAVAIANTRAATAYANAVAFANAAVTNGTWTAANSLYANNAGGVGGIAVNFASPSDGFVLAYDAGSSKIVFKNPSNITVALNANTITANLQLQAGSNGSAYVANIYSNATVSTATFRANTISFTVDSGSIALNSPTTVNGSLTVGTTTVNSTAVNVGNSTVFTSVNSTAFSGTANNSTYLNGTTLSTIQSQITGNAATAYSNATSYADTKAGQAYTNAVAVAATDAANKAATAYTNAAAYADTKAGQAYTNAVAKSAADAAAVYLPLTGGSLSGDLAVTGNLVVTGTTFYANVSNLEVRDLNISMGLGATSNATSNGAGITIAVPNAQIFYSGSANTWNLNRSLTPAANVVFSLGSTSSVWSEVYANQLHGTLMTASQPNITANNTTYFGGLTLSTVQSQITGNAATAYSNAVSVASSDATNKAANAYANAVAQANLLAATAYTNAYVVAVKAYTNAIIVADQFASNAYVNAVAQATTLAGAAYSNAVTYVGTNPLNAANATNSKNINGQAGTVATITSGQVTGALGYTPYNSTNPSGYISNITINNGTGITGGGTGSSFTIGVTNPTLRHVSTGYTSGGQVFVSSTQPTASAKGDIWIQI